MTATADRAVAIVGVGAILPDAPTPPPSGRTSRDGRYAISDVDPERWDPALYYDPDPQGAGQDLLEDRRLGARLGLGPAGLEAADPAEVGDAMDDGQKWAVACTRMALLDAGWPDRPLDPERTAVILGNAMAGEKHYLTALRIAFPELARDLEQRPSFAALPADVRAAIARELHAQPRRAGCPTITEDTMPGELANCIAGRVANLFNLRGPELHRRRGLRLGDGGHGRRRSRGSSAHEFDAVITGGVDRNMGVVDVREVLQDRRAVGHRHAPVRRRRRRLRDGRGRGAVRAQAPGRRRARRRPHLRRAARHRRLQRRQGQGHHRAQPGRPAAGGRARLAQRRAVARRRAR